MIKNLLLVAVVIATLGATTRPVMAQKHFQGDITTVQSNSQATGVNQGLFHVTIDEVGLTNKYQITVFYVSTFATAFTSPAYTDDLIVRVHEGSNLAIIDPISSGSGGVNSVPYDTNHVPQGGLEFVDPHIKSPDQITLGSEFSGFFFVTGSATITEASVSLATQNGGDGSGQGFFTQNDTPEGVSPLHLMTGLMAVAVCLRRRQSVRMVS